MWPMVRKRHEGLRLPDSDSPRRRREYNGPVYGVSNAQVRRKKDMIGRLPDGFIARSFHCNTRLGVVASVISHKSNFGISAFFS
jgi:hypothetical protein